MRIDRSFFFCHIYIMASVRSARYRSRRASRRVYPIYVGSLSRPITRSNNSINSRRVALMPAKNSFLPISVVPSNRFVYNSFVGSRSTIPVSDRSTPAKVHSPLSGVFLSRPIARALVCARRSIRREVLIANGFRGGGNPRNFSNSHVRC